MLLVNVTSMYAMANRSIIDKATDEYVDNNEGQITVGEMLTHSSIDMR